MFKIYLPYDVPKLNTNNNKKKYPGRHGRYLIPLSFSYAIKYH